MRTAGGDNHWTRRFPERVQRGDEHYRKRREYNGARGSRHGHAKLTEQMVNDIRAQYIPGRVSQQSLADQYGVSQVTISLMVRHKFWTHIQPSKT